VYEQRSKKMGMLDKRQADLAKDVKALQDAFTDYNMVLEKVRACADAAWVGSARPPRSCGQTLSCRGGPGSPQTCLVAPPPWCPTAGVCASHQAACSLQCSPLTSRASSVVGSFYGHCCASSTTEQNEIETSWLYCLVAGPSLG
jgi:hypothetical protein